MSRRRMTLSLPQRRTRLSPVIDELDRLGAVVVSPKCFEASGDTEAQRPRPIRGTLTLCADLEEGSTRATEAWLAMAGKDP